MLCSIDMTMIIVGRSVGDHKLSIPILLFLLNRNPFAQVSWYTAFMMCRRLNMQLVSIDNQSEHEALLLALYNFGKLDKLDRFWMSGYKAGYWLWMGSGHPIGPYTNWGPGQPDNSNNVEDCLEMCRYLENYVWNDLRCSLMNNFVCEHLVDVVE